MKKKKTNILFFLWPAYEANGGWRDFQGAYDDLDQALKAAKEEAKSYGTFLGACWHIMHKGKIIGDDDGED